MSRNCAICCNPKRSEIDVLLIQSVPYRDIARQFNVSKDGVYRHKAHLNSALLKAHEAQEVARGDTLLEQIKSLQSKALSILSKAEESENWRVALSAIREAREILELLSRLSPSTESEGARFEFEGKDALSRRFADMSDNELIQFITGGRYSLKDCTSIFTNPESPIGRMEFPSLPLDE